MRKSFILLLLLLLSCSISRVSAPVAVYKPSEIIRAGRYLVGHRIRAAGYMVIAENTRELWDSREDFEQSRRSGSPEQWNRCINFYYDLNLQPEIDRLNRSAIMASVTVGDPEGSIDILGCNSSFIAAHGITGNQRNLTPGTDGVHPYGFGDTCHSNHLITGIVRDRRGHEGNIPPGAQRRCGLSAGPSQPSGCAGWFPPSTLGGPSACPRP